MDKREYLDALLELIPREDPIVDVVNRVLERRLTQMSDQAPPLPKSGAVPYLTGREE